jgi:hypothetical protein
MGPLCDSLGIFNYRRLGTFEQPSIGIPDAINEGHLLEIKGQGLD